MGREVTAERTCPVRSRIVHLDANSAAHTSLMIALALEVRPTETMEASLWLDLIRHRLRHFDSLALECGQSLVLMPGIGSILVDDDGFVLRMQGVVRDERAAAHLRAALSNEIAAAVPESTAGRRVTLDWSIPAVVPVPLRG